MKKINDNISFDEKDCKVVCKSSSTHAYSIAVARVFGGFCTFTANNKGVGVMDDTAVKFEFETRNGKCYVQFLVMAGDGKQIGQVLDDIDLLMKFVEDNTGRHIKTLRIWSDILSRSSIYELNV